MAIKLLVYGLSIILCINYKQLSAQQPEKNISISIKAKIFNIQQQPLSQVTVSLYKSEDSLNKKKTISSSTGSFAIEDIKPGRYYLRASSIGYHTYQSSLIYLDEKTENITLPDIVLQPQSKELKEVLVTSKKNTFEISNGKLIYNVDQSVAATGSSAFELLQRTPGVSVTQDENIMLNGSATVNVMMDGKMTYLSGQQLSNMLKGMSSENISRIEIINTPTAQYDASGNAGIINIVTKKSNKQGYAADINAALGAGYYLLNRESITSNIKTRKLNIFGNLGYDYRHSLTTKTSTQIIGNNNDFIVDRETQDIRKSYYYFYKAGIDLYVDKKQEVGFSFSGSIDDWSRIGSGPSYLKNSSYQVNSVIQNNQNLKEPYYNNIFNLNYKFSLDTMGKKISADADYIIYRNNSDGYIANQEFKTSGASLQPYQQLNFHQPSNINIRSLKTDLELPYKQVKLLAGIKFSDVTIDNNFRYDSLLNNSFEYAPSLSDHFVYKEQIAAAYISASKKWQSTSINLGLRVEHTLSNGNSISLGNDDKRKYTNLFPSISFNQALNAKSKLDLSISRRINRPAYSNLNPVRYFSDKYSYYQGNPNLKPEKAWLASISYTLGDKYIATFTFNTSNNFISQNARMDNNILISSNTNFSNRKRFDLLLTAPFIINSAWNINSTVDLNYENYPLLQLSGFAKAKKLSVNIRINQTISFPYDIGFELMAQYNSPQLNGIYSSKRYFSATCGVKKPLIKKRLDAKFSCSDLFHTANYWGYSITNTINNNYKYVSDSRRLYIIFTYHIGGQLTTNKTHQLDEQNRL
ncbi:MAG: outer membrane beta-barrel protein [Ferruginibacter sp.]